VLPVLLGHGGVAGALIELAVLVGVLALFAAIAWWVGRRALADQERVRTPPPPEGDGQQPPPVT
jgi:hypothetical protein